MLGRPQSLPWLCHALLFASVVTAIIAPSNTTTATQGFQGTIPLKQTNDQTSIADLVPLTTGAAQSPPIEGNLFNTNATNGANVSSGDILYISCNPDDYIGFIGAERVFENAFGKTNLTAVILYSSVTDYCSYTPPATTGMIIGFPVLSMTNKSTSAMLHSQIANLPISMKYFVKIQGRGNDSNNNNNSNSGPGGQGQNPLGPSPSTAVAMIILYSITGIITALFLVIIVTGAIRAHRHPERYGPRDVLGRPRQSRARGLGRAILDTIPIVKFGEKEQDPTKPTDVELASTAETRNVDGTSETGRQNTNPSTLHTGDDAAITRDAGAPKPAAATTLSQSHEEGIAPAQAVATTAPAGKDSSSHDENLGCSICTEDFEKGQDLRVLPCDHKFHPECVDPWLLNVSGTCPLCRVDLRPVTSHDSAASQQMDDHNPTAADMDPSQHRRTAFRDILYFRTRPNATPQERIYALRRLREQRRARDEETNQDELATTTETPADRRRSRRISTRLSDVFSSRPRRERSPVTQQGESSQSATQLESTRDPSPLTPSSNQRN